jgi:hypothetical protein
MIWLLFVVSVAGAQTHPLLIQRTDPTTLPDRTPDQGTSRTPTIEVGTGISILSTSEYRVLLEASWSGYTDEGRPEIYHRLFAVSGRLEVDPIQGVRAVRVEVTGYRRSDERNPRLTQTWDVISARASREALAGLDFGVRIRALGYQVSFEGRGEEDLAVEQVTPFVRVAAQVLGYGFFQAADQERHAFDLGEARAEAGLEWGPSYGRGWVFRWVVLGASAEAAYLPQASGFATTLRAWTRLDLAFREAPMRERLRLSVQGTFEHWQWGSSATESVIPRIDFSLGGGF